MATTNLLTLPLELRDNIYEHLFAPVADEEVQLRDTSPPEKALLLVCRQTYSEAGRIYRAAYRSYWQRSRFVLNGDDPEFDSILSINEADLEQIESCTVMCTPHLFDNRLWTYWSSYYTLDRSGRWRVTFCWTQQKESMQYMTRHLWIERCPHVFGRPWMRLGATWWWTYGPPPDIADSIVVPRQEQIRALIWAP